MNENATLQEIMWENALRSGPAERAAMEQPHSWRDWAGVGIGLLLVTIGALGIRFCPNEFGLRFSEAIFIAGVLTTVVDPFLKKRLLKEASRDIFHHLLGFDLPLEIRENLSDFLLHNRSYRKNAIVEVTVTPINGNDVELIVTFRADVVAVAKTTYAQHISFEEAERGTILEASVTSQSYPKQDYAEQNPPLTPVVDELMVSCWTGREFELKTDECLNAFVRFRMQKPINDFWALYFGLPTIHPKLHINDHPDLIITASKADQVNGNEHVYKKVFMPGDHFQIRWKPKGVRKDA